MLLAIRPPDRCLVSSALVAVLSLAPAMAMDHAAGAPVPHSTRTPATSAVFPSFGAFVAALARQFHRNPTIGHLCRELGITGSQIEAGTFDDAQTKLLAEAMATANKGLCIDEAFLAAQGLAAGKDPALILKEIAARREELAVFNGLVQGPFQDKAGGDACMKAIFEQYGHGPLQAKGIAFAFREESGGKALVELLQKSPNRVFLMAVQTVREHRTDGHVIALKMNADGAGALVYDSDWSEVPLAATLELLQNYHHEMDQKDAFNRVVLYGFPSS